MLMRNNVILLFLVTGICYTPGITAAAENDKTTASSGEITSTEGAVLWRQPDDIPTRNLYYGPGGKEHEPHGAFKFLKEDMKGSNPKFDVQDQDGVKWKVKLGVEAKPETVASRIVWAVGYFTNEDYFVGNLKVDDMPAHLQRKHADKFFEADHSMNGVRLKRDVKGEKKIGTWQWHRDPFAGTREYNGLRVLMAVINNWDLKDENNAIYQEKHSDGQDSPELIYMVSDLGASFGSTNLRRTHEESKGNLEAYRQSKFIRDVHSDYVDFNVPSRPAFIVLVNPHEFFSRVRLEWIGRHIPRDDAKWMGQLLGQLSPEQIQDAFRAAGYSPEDIEAFSSVVESRIAALKNL